MKKIITFHSYRRGAGKTHIAACVASLLALDGYKVGIMDTSFLSPGIQILFQLDENQTRYKLNDYVLGNCGIKDIVYDVSHCLSDHPTSQKTCGKIYLSPASLEPLEILRVLRQGSDLDRLGTAQQEMIDSFELDVLVIDTYSGLNQNSIHSTALSSALTLIMRLDKQDYDGTGILLDIARKLNIPNITMVINESPRDYSLDGIKKEIENSYHCSVGAVIPHTEEIQTLASKGVFVLKYPEHPLTSIFRNLADSLINNSKSRTAPHLKI